MKLDFCNFVIYFFVLAIFIFRKSNLIFSIINTSLWDLPSPTSINYFWNFGSVLGVCLGVQILSGFFLRFHYVSFSFERFNSIALIMREVWYGWLLRFFHMNGASLFFFFIYLHLFRGIFYFRAVHLKVWLSGLVILFLLIGISFLGYVLPWGQISYWAVAVITNLLSVIPYVGPFLVEWIWGGFTVGLPTLLRFYSLHFILPFLLFLVVFFHLLNLHDQGSRNPLGISRNLDKLVFHPYFSIKDLFFFVFSFILFRFLYFYYPYFLSDPVNNIPANFMQTPTHIQPEWYFLPYYAILRSFPSKVGGVIAFVFSVVSFSFLAFFDFEFSPSFSFYRRLIFWFFLFNFLFLMKMGALPAEEPFIFLRKISSFLYFRFLFLLNF